jgi:hypothetical protein
MIQKIVFISWAIACTRSDSLSYHLGGICYHIHYLKKSRFQFIYAPIKYVLAAFKTISILRKDQPEVILVQNPPIFAIPAVWFYCVFNKAAFITDTHSAAFDRTKWTMFLWLYRILGKRALVNIVHNKPLEEKIKKWNLPSITIGDMPYRLETNLEYTFKPGFNIVVVNTYSDDEPLDEVITAALQLPDVNFYITGNLKSAPKNIISKIPSNVILTDFIAFEEYVALLKGCDVVVVLTTQDFTMQNGAWEATELEKPIITSDWPVLREGFHKGTIHINNSPSDLVKAIQEMQNNYSTYLSGIKDLRKEKYGVWKDSFSHLQKLIKEHNNSK